MTENNTNSTVNEIREYRFILSDGTICTVPAHSEVEAAAILREQIRA